MKSLGTDVLKALFWVILIITIVLFSTGGYQEFIYRNF